jgi:hypothetical protein
MTAPPPVRAILGGIFRDVRGVVRHVNDFNFEKVDRFYTISPATPGEARGWVGHRRDWKWFFAVKGRFDVGIVRPMSWVNPSPEERVKSIRLDAEEPFVLEIPPGNFTASRALDSDSSLLVFSSGKIEEVAADDFRLPSEFWTIP